MAGQREGVDNSDKERKWLEFLRKIFRFPGSSGQSTTKEWRAKKDKNKQSDWGDIGGD